MKDTKEIQPAAFDDFDDEFDLSFKSSPAKDAALPDSDAEESRTRKYILPLVLAVVVLVSVLAIMMVWGVGKQSSPTPPGHETDTPIPPADSAGDSEASDPAPDNSNSNSDDDPDNAIPGINISQPGSVENPTPPDTPSDPEYQYSCDVSTYLPAINLTPTRSEIVLANKTSPLGMGYKPKQMVMLPKELTFYGKEIELDATAASALQAMLLCMRADGITDTFATSGYRSYQYQSTLFDYYIQMEREKNPRLTYMEAVALVLTYSAEPGTSEHQTGLCVDLITTTMSALDTTFENTRAFAWLQKNAHQFGFILRYPEGKEDITGYSYEPWHYRFVGKEIATEIRNANLTLEEYLEME